MRDGLSDNRNPILQNNLIAVFVDVDIPTYNLDTSQLEAALSPRTRAIVVAHTLGNPFDLSTVKEFATRHGLFLVEDCCDALGARYDGKMVGTFGEVGTLSFYPAHHITMREGGAVFTNNPRLACALSSGKISVLSDGTPWRPLIDIRDMARAMEWAATRPAAHGGRFLSVNVGSNERNYQVSQLAEAVARAVPSASVSVNTQAPADSRSYRVDFSLFASLAPNHQPRVTLADSVEMLKTGLQAMGFADAEFRTSAMMRLNVLNQHIAAGRLATDLRWLDPRTWPAMQQDFASRRSPRRALPS